MSQSVKSKRRSSEKRKEKSRDAARCRRSQEADIFKDLANQLPIQSTCLSQLDKASIIRLVIAHIRLRHLFEFVDSPKENPINSIQQKIDQLHFKTLDGFLLLVEKRGEVIYVSENIEKYLGIAQVDVLGQNVFDFLHPCDHEELRDLLYNKSQQSSDDDNAVESFVRMKCTLTIKGHNINIKSASYKIIEISGHTVNHLNHSADVSFAVLVGQPLPDLTHSELCLDQRMFVSRHSLDLHFMYCDNEVINLLGFSPQDLMGKSVFKFHHAYDAEVIDKAYKTLFMKGESKTGLYRFLAKNGGYVWMQTHATVVGEAVCERLKCIICINYVISGIEYPEQIFSDVQIAPSQNVVNLVSNENVIEDDPDEVIVYEDDEDNGECDGDGCCEATYGGMQFVTEKFIGIKAVPVSCWNEQHGADTVTFNANIDQSVVSVTDDQENDPDLAAIKVTRSMPLLDDSTLEELVSLENRAPYIPMDDDMCFGSLPFTTSSCVDAGLISFSSGPLDEDDDILSIIKTFDQSTPTPEPTDSGVLIHDAVLSAAVSLKRPLSEKEQLLAANNFPIPACKAVKLDYQQLSVMPTLDATVSSDVNGSSVLRNLLTTGVDTSHGYKLKDVYPAANAELNSNGSDYDSLESFSSVVEPSEDLTSLLFQLLNPTPATSADMTPEQTYLADAADVVYVITA